MVSTYLEKCLTTVWRALRSVIQFFRGDLAWRKDGNLEQWSFKSLKGIRHVMTEGVGSRYLRFHFGAADDSTPIMQVRAANPP
jgi:hypothetical protein